MTKYEELKSRLEKAVEYFEKVYETDILENQIRATDGLVKLNRMCFANMSAIEYENVKPLMDKIDNLVCMVIDSQIERRKGGD